MNKKGKLICHTGTMFSGKTTALISDLKRSMIGKKEVILFKPLLDNRYSSDEVYTHDGQKLKAFNITCIKEIFEIIGNTPSVDVIGIDEVQFFNSKEDIDNIIKLVNVYNKVVIVAGLDMDYQGNPFGSTPYLMAMADEVHKYKAVCSDCGEDSMFEYRISGGDNLIELGSTDSYISLCRYCRNKRLHSISIVDEIVEDFINLKKFKEYYDGNKMNYIEDMCVIDDRFEEDVYNKVINKLKEKNEI